MHTQILLDRIIKSTLFNHTRPCRGLDVRSSSADDPSPRSSSATLTSRIDPKHPCGRRRPLPRRPSAWQSCWYHERSYHEGRADEERTSRPLPPTPATCAPSTWEGLGLECRFLWPSVCWTLPVQTWPPSWPARPACQRRSPRKCRCLWPSGTLPVRQAPSQKPASALAGKRLSALIRCSREIRARISGARRRAARLCGQARRLAS